MKLNYTKVGDYLLPNLKVNQQKGNLNKYGYLRLDYLKEHKQGLYTALLIQDKLMSHLFSVSKEAEDRLNVLMEHYQKSDKLLSEKNKETNQMEWVKLSNNYKNMAEETILKELVYV